MTPIKYILFYGPYERSFTTDEALFEFIQGLPHNARIEITVVGETA